MEVTSKLEEKQTKLSKRGLELLKKGWAMRKLKVKRDELHER